VQARTVNQLYLQTQRSKQQANESSHFVFLLWEGLPVATYLIQQQKKQQGKPISRQHSEMGSLLKA
jgi:hypothetical protein